jgi:hypothetical protein
MKRMLASFVFVAAIGMAGTVVPGAASGAEFGQCRELTTVSTPKVGHGKYIDNGCVKKSTTVPVSGSFEWYKGPPASCIHQTHGEYTNNTCTTKSTKPKSGAYERQPCYGATGKGCAELSVTSSVQHGGSLECKGGETANGMFTGVKVATAVQVGLGCQLQTGGPDECHGVEPPGSPGEIVGVASTEVTLLSHKEKTLGGGEPAVNEVWIQEANQLGAHAPNTYRFSCALSGPIEDRGFSAYPVSPINVMGTEATIDEEGAVGEHNTESAFCTDETFETCGPFTGYTTNRTLFVHANAPYEVRDLKVTSGGG